MSAPAPTRRFPLLLILGSVLALIQLGILWSTTLPLGVPKEWVWERTDLSLIDLVNFWPGILVGGLLWGFVSYQSSRIANATSKARTRSLLILWLLGTLWILSAISSIPGIAGLSRAPFVLYYTRSSGYFTQAREEAKDLRTFLSTYRQRIDDSTQPENYLHIGTHPPGLTTAFAAMIAVCDRSPALCSVILATQPASIEDAFSVIGMTLSPEQQKTWRADQAVIWLATLIVALCATGASVPLFLLASRTCSREAAWWAASFWLLVPATAIFLPKSDVMFAGLAMWIQWLWLEGVDRRSLRYGAFAGAAIFVAVCLSLAFVPLGLMMVLQGLVLPSFSSSGSLKTTFKAESILIRANVFLSSGVVFVGLILLVGVMGNINLLSVWLQNLSNHASFYSHATRTYLSWLWMNPVELGFSLGLPIALLTVVGLAGLVIKRSPSLSSPTMLAANVRRPVELIIPLTVWGMLWVSGKNMGEAARLWVFLMPFAVWLAAFGIERGIRSSESSRWVKLYFLIQLIVCLGTVTRIDGFHFAELAP